MSPLWHLGDDTVNAASRECHCTGVERVKKVVVCYFQGIILNPTSLLNHVAPFIELMMQCEQYNTNNYSIV